MKTLSKKLIEEGSFVKGETIDTTITSLLEGVAKIADASPGKIDLIIRYTLEGKTKIFKKTYTLKNEVAKIKCEDIPKNHKDYSKYSKILENN
ncbi:MAG: hypothetical protein AABX88_00860 [Nanoarchaeota archaeon]